MNLLGHVLLVISNSWIIYYHASAQQLEVCNNLYNRKMDCIDIKQCPALLNLLQKRNPPTQSTINFLRQFHCGYKGKTPYVCCPDQKEAVVDEYPNTDYLFKDVSYHPRLNMLPRNCGIATIGDKITMGSRSHLAEFPWMALLGYVTNSTRYSGSYVKYRCGGTLISDRYVLTAAHCLTNLDIYRLVTVRLGEHDLSKEIDCEVGFLCSPPVQDLRIEEVISHPNYSKSNLKNDIGLIRLAYNPTINNAVKPVCLPIGLAEQSETLNGKTVTVSGWGKTETGIYSNVLLRVNLKVIPLRNCSQIYKNGQNLQKVDIGKTQICAGGIDGMDSCNGDSGGPLQTLARRNKETVFVQHGIVSFGPHICGAPMMPGVYTKVGYYMHWILDSMKP